MEGAEEVSRARLALLWNQIPLSEPLTTAEVSDVTEIANRLVLVAKLKEYTMSLSNRHCKVATS
ncbi:Uncharacterised protein [Mycobacteroides abscessus subsp. abscessus]|nr:Uncharacterised protein [Mycobacteroides abscessus subsp. abscessus]